MFCMMLSDVLLLCMVYVVCLNVCFLMFVRKLVSFLFDVIL